MLLVQKLTFFKLSFLGNIGQKNVFYDILERENAYLGCRNKKFKNPKNWHFTILPKPMVLVQKETFFKLFFSGNIGQKKFFYDILERKNAFLGYRKEEVQKVKK